MKKQQVQPAGTFAITLQPHEVQVIYGALTKRPYEEVANLIASFVRQVEEQEAAAKGNGSSKG